MTNEQILKADMVQADLNSNGGLLNDEQANRFIRKLIEQPTLLRQIRVVEMNSPTRQVNKIGFGKRILRAGAEGTALATAAVDGAFDPDAEKTARAKPTTEQILLTTKEVIAEVVLTYDVIEDNIERGNTAASGGTGTGGPNAGGIMNTILDLMAERVSLDLEEGGILGDTAASVHGPTPTGDGDTYLLQWDGFLKRATSNVVNGAAIDSGALTLNQFEELLKDLPDAYLRNRSMMRHFLSVDQEINYRALLGARATDLGDRNITSNGNLFAYGVPVEAVSLMPSANILFTDPMNLLMGIQRRVTVEFDKNISSRTFNFVVTARVDFQIEEEEAVVKTTGLTGS
jgi:hypothetical protein